MITVNVRLMPHLLFFTIVLHILKVKRWASDVAYIITTVIRVCP